LIQHIVPTQSPPFPGLQRQLTIFIFIFYFLHRDLEGWTPENLTVELTQAGEAVIYVECGSSDAFAAGDVSGGPSCGSIFTVVHL
jgi:hypothetical protein